MSLCRASRRGSPWTVTTVHIRRYCRWLIALCVFCMQGVAVGASGDGLLALIREPGHALLIRHAYAPGTGDPSNFRIGDCATQRNLDERGRAEARAAGERLRRAGISGARIFSSEWCRCTETAELLGLGAVERAPGLNSFFSRPGLEARYAAAATELIRRAIGTPGPVIMVTHHVTIAALTGRNVGTAEAAVVKVVDGGVRLIGTVALSGQL